MNLHFGAREPLGRLLFSNLFPFTTVYRPAGSAVYVALFEAFGLTAVYYRIATYGMLLLACVGVYRLASNLDGRVTAGALAAAPMAFHTRLLHLYTYGGYLYDVLCGVLFAAAVLFYHWRRSKGMLRWRDVAVLYLLWALAVNAKEIALTLPVVLMAYEVVFSRPLQLRQFIWPGVLMLFSFGSWWGKTQPWSPLYDHSTYKPTLNMAHMFYETQRQVGDALWARGAVLPLDEFVVAVIVFVGAALAVRRKAALFGLLWAVITPLPVLAIASRPLSAMYIPWMGVCLVVGVVGAEALERLRIAERWKPWAVPAFACVWALLQLQDVGHRPSIREAGAEWEHVRTGIRLYSELPGLCQADSLMVLDSRFDTRYHPVFLKELFCDEVEPHVAILGLNITAEESIERMDEYDLVIRDKGDELEVLRSRVPEAEE